ncbi:hypothetical protein [Syntrophomonas erecta]
MFKRRWLWFIMAGVIAVYLLSSGNSSSINFQETLSHREILKGFDSALPGSRLYLMSDFLSKGDIFYLTRIEKGQRIVYKYRIDEKQDNKGLKWKSEDSWEGITLPENQFTVYEKTATKWVKLK